MANVSAATKFFATASETYSNNLSSSIIANAVNVPVNAATEYADGEVVALTVEPGTANEATFTGEKASVPSRFINCKWTEGNLGVGHASGVTIIDYTSATHQALMVKGMLVSHNQEGTLKPTAVQSALGLGAESLNGWNALGNAPSTITANGNRSYDLGFAVTMAAILSPGMRLRTTRSVAAPTQCTSLNGTSQYYNDTTVAGMTFTDDFTVSAWVKLSSYTQGTFLSRFNGTSGWVAQILGTGQIELFGTNAGAGNFGLVRSFQSIPLNKWVHITAQLDMSAFTATTTTSYVMIDGVDVPSTVLRGGTNPTALIQAGNLEIGSQNGGASLFPGKIAQVAIYSAKVTQATIRASMNQTLAGTETSLISAYSFNNTLNDLNTTNANNLTANGSALATNADSPFGIQADGAVSSTLDYAIVSKVVTSTVTVQVPEGNTIPTSGGVLAVAYSTQKAPFGFPGQRGKWMIIESIRVVANAASGAAGVVTNFVNQQLNIPVGEWNLRSWQQVQHARNAGSSTATLAMSISTSASSLEGSEERNVSYLGQPTAGLVETVLTFYQERNLSLATAAPYYFVVSPDAVVNTLNLRGDIGRCQIIAENAYL